MVTRPLREQAHAPYGITQCYLTGHMVEVSDILAFVPAKLVLDIATPEVQG